MPQNLLSDGDGVLRAARCSASTERRWAGDAPSYTSSAVRVGGPWTPRLSPDVGAADHSPIPGARMTLLANALFATGRSRTTPGFTGCIVGVLPGVMNPRPISCARSVSSAHCRPAEWAPSGCAQEPTSRTPLCRTAVSRVKLRKDSYNYPEVAPRPTLLMHAANTSGRSTETVSSPLMRLRFVPARTEWPPGRSSTSQACTCELRRDR